VGGHVADGVLQVLDAERDAGQRSGVVAGGDPHVDRVSLVERTFGVHGDERVVRRVQPLDPAERRLGQLARADLFCPHRVR
jgi:hypothetical protein